MYASSVDNRSLLSMKLWIVDLQFMPVALQYFLDCAHFQLCRRTDCNVGKLNNDDMCNTLPSPLASLLSDGKSAIAMRFGSRGPSCSSRIRCRNALTEKAWEKRRTLRPDNVTPSLFPKLFEAWHLYKPESFFLVFIIDGCLPLTTALAGIMSACTLAQVVLGEGKPFTWHTNKVILFPMWSKPSWDLRST